MRMAHLRGRTERRVSVFKTRLARDGVDPGGSDAPGPNADCHPPNEWPRGGNYYFDFVSSFLLDLAGLAVGL